MTPSLQQAIKLLQMTRLELQSVVTQELVENPILEEAEEQEADAEGEAASSRKRSRKSPSAASSSERAAQSKLAQGPSFFPV